jgi:hypothetical protein
MTTAKIDKVIEGCSELIQALCKVKRFGWFSRHPDSCHTTNMDNVQYEAQDVMEALKDCKRICGRFHMNFIRERMIIGKNGISAEVVEHSISEAGQKVVTVALKYGLIIHAEFLRHRQLTRCVKSNRAIPMKVIRREVLTDPYVPVFFGQNKAGMVASTQAKSPLVSTFLWKSARIPVCGMHWLMEKAGVHKEITNRILSPWQWVRETVTATELEGLYTLRLHKDAQRDIQEIVRVMKEAIDNTTPTLLKYGEFHTPYVDKTRGVSGRMRYWDNGVGHELTVEEAIKCSAARCARSSYDKHDGTTTTKEIDIPLYEQLIESEPSHESPVEHVCTPLLDESMATHTDMQRGLWSANFRGWAQWRHIKDTNSQM